MPPEHPTLLTKVIRKNSILLYPEGEGRGEVLKALFDLLVNTERLTRRQATTALRLVDEREAMGSTAIGNGVALPHARAGHVKEAIGAFALLNAGSGFNALDGAPVKYVFLFLTPEKDDSAHVKVLKSVTLFASQPIHLKALSGCKTTDEVLSVFSDYA